MLLRPRRGDEDEEPGDEDVNEDEQEEEEEEEEEYVEEREFGGVYISSRSSEAWEESAPAE